MEHNPKEFEQGSCTLGASPIVPDSEGDEDGDH